MRFIFEGKSRINPADESMIRILLPVVYIRKGSADPVDNRVRIKEKDLIIFLINKNRLDEANDWLDNNGFVQDQSNG